MVEEFRETGFGGVYYGGDTPSHRQRRYLEEHGVQVDGALQENIDIATRQCTRELVELQGEGRDPFDEKVRECDIWLSDIVKSHLSMPQVIELGDIDYMELLGIRVPDADWLAYVTDVPVVVKNAYELCVETPECRFDLRGAAGIIIKNYIQYRMWRRGTFIVGKAIKHYGAGALILNARAVYYLYKAFENIAFTGADIWDAYQERKGKGVEPVRDSYSYYNLEEYEEDIMPYNRRTGQWYPQRRRQYGTPRYGSRSGGYRRRSYGNSNYGNNYAPRRRRYNASRW